MSLRPPRAAHASRPGDLGLRSSDTPPPSPAMNWPAPLSSARPASRDLDPVPVPGVRHRHSSRELAPQRMGTPETPPPPVWPWLFVHLRHLPVQPGGAFPRLPGPDQPGCGDPSSKTAGCRSDSFLVTMGPAPR